MRRTDAIKKSLNVPKLRKKGPIIIACRQSLQYLSRLRFLAADLSNQFDGGRRRLRFAGRFSFLDEGELCLDLPRLLVTEYCQCVQDSPSAIPKQQQAQFNLQEVVHQAITSVRPTMPKDRKST